MAFGGLENGDGQRPMAEINTTPLVDVMLVLLIIFIITAPLLTHAVKINLPHAASQASPDKAETVTIAIDAAGTLYWNGEPIPAAQLFARMTAAAKAQPQPDVHLRVDRDTRYQRVAELLSAARNAGLSKIGFVTDPNAAPAWTVASPPPAD
jgi:biopolymer transport protein ExbD